MAKDEETPGTGAIDPDQKSETPEPDDQGANTPDENATPPEDQTPPADPAKTENPPDDQDVVKMKTVTYKGSEAEKKGFHTLYALGTSTLFKEGQANVPEAFAKRLKKAGWIE